MSSYRCIVADPPWPQQRGGPLRGREGWHDAKGASLPMKYLTMSVAEIAAMPIADLAHPDGAHLYLWTTNGFLRDAFSVLAAWGFEYSTTLVWAKTPMGGGLGGAYGISTEFFLYARRGRLAPLNEEPLMTIRTYRKIPIELQAVRFTGTNIAEVVELTGPNNFMLVGAAWENQDPEIKAKVWDKLHSTWVGVKPGQWIMKGTEGEHWPVDNAVFVKSYEAVSESDAA